MSQRRPVGALESAVLEILWAARGPLTARQVLDQLDSGLAYTTVVTILTRLIDKDLVEREKEHRAYLYRPRVTEADLMAGRMRAVLSSSGDHQATLSRFVEGLSRKDLRALRALLDDLRGPRR